MPDILEGGGLELFIEGTFIFILGPLLASGIALLWAGKKGEQDAEEELMTGKHVS